MASATPLGDPFAEWPPEHYETPTEHEEHHMAKVSIPQTFDSHPFTEHDADRRCAVCGKTRNGKAHLTFARALNDALRAEYLASQPDAQRYIDTSDRY